MFKGIILVFTSVLFLLFPFRSLSHIYYFSDTDGIDTRSMEEAQNPETPWKSLSKLNEVFRKITPGDTILLKRGNVFFGSLELTQSGTFSSPIVIGAYGTGNNPVITSLQKITDLRPYEKGIYQSKVNAKEINMVIWNNLVQEMGRFPNREKSDGGYFTYKPLDHEGIEIDKDIASIDWTGGTIVIRKNNWIRDQHPILSQKGSRLQLGSIKSQYLVQKSNEYFIQNHIKTLDREGEWHFDEATGIFSIYLGNTSPDNQDIYVPSMDHLLVSKSQSNLVVSQIEFKGSNQYSILLESGQNIQILDCKISYSGKNAVAASNILYFQLKNCEIRDTQNNAVHLGYGSHHAHIRNNKILNTHIHEGLGQSGDSNGFGIMTMSDYSLIEYNEVLHTGYSGIYFGGEGTSIQNNYVHNFCTVKFDGGGIYTYTGSSNKEYLRRKITDNIVSNSLNSENATENISGIYLDDNASGIEITGNTVANIGLKGINVHNARNLQIKKNTIYNCQNQLILQNDHYGNDIRNLVIEDNTLVSTDPYQKTIAIRSHKNDIKKMGTFENSCFVHLTDNPHHIYIEYKKQGVDYAEYISQDQWKSDFDWDKKSGAYALPGQQQVMGDSGSNRSIFTGTFDKGILPGSYCFSPNNNCNISWAPDSPLESGAMLVASNGNTRTVINTGNLQKTKNYLLRFSAAGNKTSSIKVFFIKSAIEIITKEKVVVLNNDRTEYEIIFSPDNTVSKSSLVLETGSGDLEFYVDNISIVESNADNIASPEDRIRLHYNPLPKNKVIQTGSNFKDLRGDSNARSITLLPYSSVVLIRNQKEQVVPSPIK